VSLECFAVACDADRAVKETEENVCTSAEPAATLTDTVEEPSTAKPPDEIAHNLPTAASAVSDICTSEMPAGHEADSGGGLTKPAENDTNQVLPPSLDICPRVKSELTDIVCIAAFITREHICSEVLGMLTTIIKIVYLRSSVIASLLFRPH